MANNDQVKISYGIDEKIPEFGIINLAQSNALTNSRYNFSKIEKNVLYCIIRKVRHDYIEGTVQRGLWQNMYVTMTNADLALAAGDDNLNYAKTALRTLRHRDIEMEDEEGNWLNTGFVNVAKYRAKEKTWEIEVSKEIMPHLVELARNFTSYSLTVAISLKSKYSQRFYEWAHEYLNRDSDTFFIEIENLRHMLMLGSGYAQKGRIVDKIINVAMRELKESYDAGECDLWLECFDKGRGNKTTFYFKIHRRGDDQKNTEDVINKGREIHKLLIALFPKDPKFVERTVKALDFDPDKITPIYDRLQTLMADASVKNRAAICRYILKADYQLT